MILLFLKFPSLKNACFLKYLFFYVDSQYFSNELNKLTFANLEEIVIILN